MRSVSAVTKGLPSRSPPIQLPMREKRRDVVAGQGVFDLAIHARNLPQERGVVVRQRVLDFIRHGELGGAQHARLPKLSDARTDQRFAFAAVAVGGWISRRSTSSAMARSASRMLLRCTSVG